MASCEIRIDSSLGKSTRRRFEICSGLHDVAQRRSWRRPCLRPIQRTLAGLVFEVQRGSSALPTGSRSGAQQASLLRRELVLGEDSGVSKLR